jgi:methylisocitrate lyase
MEELYATLAREGSTKSMLPRMQTRAELYGLIDYHAYEALDASLVKTIVPMATPER